MLLCARFAGRYLWRAQPQHRFLGFQQSTQDHRDMQRTATQTTPIQAGPGPSDVRPYRERLLRIDDVCFMTGLGRSTIYAKVKAGDFPSAVQLHGTSVAWRETEVDAWIAARPAVGAMPDVQPAAKPTPTKPGRAARAPRPARAQGMGAH